MALSLVTSPSIEPVSLAEAKLHLRVDVNSEDALIDALVTAARGYVETFTRRALITQTWDLRLDGFPCHDAPIWIPKPPCSSITSVSYVDTNGDTQTWSSALYTTDLPSGDHARQGRIVPAYGEYYPSTRDVPNAVTVRFVAGYGSTAATVPAGLRAAMKILVGTWYGPGRQGVEIGSSVNVIPQTVDALLWPYRVF